MEHREAAARAVWQPDPPRGDATAVAAARARRRGLWQTGVGLAAAGLIAWLWRPEAGLVAGGVAVALGLLALVSPLGAFAAAGRLFERLGSSIGAAVAWLLLGALHFLVFLPLGVALRLRGRLRITRGFDPRLSSYWVATHRWRHDEEAYRRQF
jgi:hypothetical protein